MFLAYNIGTLIVSSMSNNPSPRVQTRQTEQPGDPVEDQYWKIISDTGPIAGVTGEIKIVAVTASGNDGNVETNVIDNDPNTRWSCLGIGSWIKLKLERLATVKQIDFQWYNDPARSYNITADFIVTQTGTSSQVAHQGNSPLSILFLADPVTASEITLKLVDTTNPKKWFSIVGVKVLGTIIGPPEPPGPGPNPPPIPPTPEDGLDKFGRKKIYGDIANPEKFSSWFMDMNSPGSDPRGNNPESSSYMPKFTKNSDGSWKIKGQNEIRWAITQDNGFHQDKLCTDLQVCQKQGFMQDSKDWGTPPSGLEMKAYYRMNAASSSTSNGEMHLEHVMKGQRSTTSNTKLPTCGCVLGGSFNLHGNNYFNKGQSGLARQKWEKDLKHTTGYSVDSSGVNNNAAYNFKMGQWFGLATVVYNLPDGNVQMEHWTDEKADNNWKKTHSWIDKPIKGYWPPRGDISGINAGDNHVINFGGPLSCFRSDNCPDYDIKWASLRSIDPTKKLMGAEHNMKTISHNTVVEEDREYQVSVV